jgi:ketosteroid isomerase-like protein
MKTLAAVLLLAASGPASAATPAATPAEVVAAERAFARDGLELGIKASFLKHSAPEAIILAPDPTNAQAFYRRRPDSKGPRPPLQWWPEFAGVAASGDLGFTTGPWVLNGGRDGGGYGYYFTVWERRPDGGWKWIFDGGVNTFAAPATTPDSPVATVPVSHPRGLYPEHAMAEVRAIEARLAAAASSDLAGAYMPWLAADARIMGSQARPAAGAAAFRTELAARPARLALSAIGGKASRAGDLVWTYGNAKWSEAGLDRRGHYVRIWQRRPEGWRMVFDEFIPIPPPEKS